MFSVAPTLEVGTEWWLGNGTLVRPLIRGGAIWYDGADFALTASFAGAPLGVSPFTINTDIDEVMGLVGAGVDVINGGDAVLRLSYDGQLGETRRSTASASRAAPSSSRCPPIRIRHRPAPGRRRERQQEARRQLLVAMATAVLRGEPGCEQSDQQAPSLSQGRQNRRLARFSMAHGILVGLIDAFLGVGLRDAGPFRYDLRQCALLRRRQLTRRARRRACGQ